MINEGLNIDSDFKYTKTIKYIFLAYLTFFALNCFSQDKTVSGIVFDKESKDRVATVSIKNATTGIKVYDNLKGEFKIIAKEGDQLIFTRQQYYQDTVKIQNNASLAIYMARLAIQLKEVSIHDSVLDPDKRLAATKYEYSKIYGSLGYRDFLTSPASGGIGVGISIDAIWNAISRSGRNAARLQEIIQADYQQNVIDYRFNRNFVGKITGLKDEKLSSFMFRYRPGFYTAKTASEYEFVSMIKTNLRRFLRNPRIYSLPSLNPGAGASFKSK